MRRDYSIPRAVRLLFAAHTIMVPAIASAIQLDQPSIFAGDGEAGYFRSETEPEDTVSRAQFLSRGALQLNGATPTVNIQGLVYYLMVGRDLMVPFYLATSLPTVADTTLEKAASGLQDEFGGLANASVGYFRKIIFGNVFNFPDDAQLGMRLDVRGGIRIDDLGESGADLEALKGFGYGLVLAKLALPVFRDRKATTRAGIVTGGISLTALYTLGGEPIEFEQSETFRGFLYLNGSAALNLTDVLSIQVGRTLTTSERNLPRRWFVGASVYPAPRTKSADNNP